MKRRIVGLHVDANCGGIGTAATTSLSNRRNKNTEFELDPPFINVTIKRPNPIGSKEPFKVETYGVCLSQVTWVEYESVEEYEARLAKEKSDDEVDPRKTE